MSLVTPPEGRRAECVLRVYVGGPFGRGGLLMLSALPGDEHRQVDEGPTLQ